MGNLVKYEKNEVALISKEQLIKYLDLTGTGKNITDSEKGMFLEIAMLNGLNPFKREIYITAYGEGSKRVCNTLTGYEVYIRRAEESGLLDGWKVETTGSVQKNDLRAKVTIYRKNFSYPFEWEASYSEFVQKSGSGEPNKFWRTMPEQMIKKVAISQGFRLCFNQVLGGMPYTQDEMPQVIEDVKHEVIEKKPLLVQKIALTNERFNAALDNLYNDTETTLLHLSKCELTPEQQKELTTCLTDIEMKKQKENE